MLISKSSKITYGHELLRRKVINSQLSKLKFEACVKLGRLIATNISTRIKSGKFAQPPTNTAIVHSSYLSE